MEEEMELEEGEAYSYHNNDQYGGCMDPDELDYIDVKLQHVLGHFQKDFEGGVSAENLGAKFGGYGSFLPTYQRSPHSKTSPNIQKKDAQPSPSPLPLEEGQRSSVVTVPAPQIQRHVPSSTATTPGSESKQHMKNSTGKEKSMPSLRTVEDENSYESENKKFSHTSDQKTLKVRIKLGSSENLSTQNKAALYSGLGLDSPSSSLEQSPFESEGRSCDPQPMGFDSPTSILQVMTSSPLNGALLLSPLADDLIFFGQKSVMEHSMRLAPRNIVGDKKQKSVEKASTESGGSRSKKHQGDVGGTLRKELDAESLAYDELVSNTMKLPIISSANNTAVDTAKVSKKPSNYKEEKAYELEAELFGPQPKGKKTSSKSSLLEGPSRVVVKEQRPSSGKKKSKGSQSSGTADNSKDSLNVSSSKSKKRPSEDSLRTKNDNADLKLRKVLGKGRDLYTDFFGDIDQEEGNPTEAAEKETKDTPKNLRLVERPVSTFSNGSKDRLKNKISEKDPIGANNLNRDFGSASGEKFTDVIPAPVDPVIINENWVQCDKCHQWRLLPLGRNTKGLPDKWVCIMLDWLPGMNRCSFTEDETNDAVRALHQAPVPVPDIKNEGYTEFSVPLKNNIVVDRKKNVDGGSQLPLKGDADLQLPSKFQDLGSDGQSHKQRPSAYYADESDVKVAKGSKKVKNEEYPDEERKPSHRNNVKKLGHTSSRGLPAATEGKSRSFDEPDHVLRHDYVDNTLTEQPREKVQLSFDSDGRGTSDSGKSASRKRKAKEPQGLQGSLDCAPSPWHQDQSTEVVIKDDEYRNHKKARESKPEGKDFTASEGNGRADRRSKKKQNLQHDPGSSQSQRESDGINSKKKGAKASGSALAATSSSSKFRKSDKGKVSLQEMKVSPGESVSSSPMRSSKHDKLLFGRSKGVWKDEAVDAASLPVSSPRQSLDGEDDGNNENGARPYRKSLEASDRDDHVGATDKEKVVPPIDISHNRPLKVIVAGSDRAAQHLAKLQDSDQRHDGHNGDKHRSGKSGKGSNGEKRRSSKHDRRAADKKKVSDPSKDSQERRDGDEKKRDASRDGKKGSKSSQDAVLNQANDEEKSSTKVVPGRGKGQTLAPSGAVQEGLKPKIKIDSKLVGAVDGDDAAKISGKNERGVAHQNGKRQQNDKHLSSNGTTQDIGTTTPIRRESLFQLANNALKEAKDLKHMADRVKTLERTGLYFEAALKFLHGASLLESSYNASLKSSEIVHSTATYADTAKLCEFCAHDYEKSKDMASAALAYKCTEVAYLKVVYLSQSNASRDRHELQTVLKMIPPGESPSSASSVDHVNNSALTDKANMAKGVNSPQVAGNQIITARNRPNFERLLNFAQNVNNGMEASRKSRAAFDSAIGKSKDSQSKETISFIRRALDYNFQDVEGLLQLVRKATEAITR